MENNNEDSNLIQLKLKLLALYMNYNVSFDPNTVMNLSMQICELKSKIKEREAVVLVLNNYIYTKKDANWHEPLTIEKKEAIRTKILKMDLIFLRNKLSTTCSQLYKNMFINLLNNDNLSTIIDIYKYFRN